VHAEPENPDVIDEASLDPEVLKKLKVMRRLSGGRANDQELLQRIYSELGRDSSASSAAAAAAKKKRGWWKN
jgi:hypothetical protein